MESIKELRGLLQKEKLDLRKNIWGYKIFRRGLSIYITRVLIPTKITPNQVSVMVLFFGVLGSIFIFMQDFWITILGFGLIYLNIVLDAVDGELARYKKIFSLRGIYLDTINHLIIPSIFFISIAFHVFYVDTSLKLATLFLAVLGALSLMLLRTIGDIPAQLFTREYLLRRNQFTFSLNSNMGKKNLSNKSLLGILKIFFYQFRQFVVIILVFFVSIIIQYLFSNYFHKYIIVNLAVILYSFYLIFFAFKEIVTGFFLIEDKVHILEKKML